MRFSIASPLLASALAAVTFTASAQFACTTDFHGTAEDLRVAQEDAIVEFGRLFLVEKDAQKAFDLYIPGEYINHNPYATSGRDNALNILVPALKDPSLSISNQTWFAGQGFGLLHYKMTFNGSSSAVMDRFKFAGSCIVEHWDSVQSITGNENNPIAFF